LRLKESSGQGRRLRKKRRKRRPPPPKNEEEKMKQVKSKKGKSTVGNTKQ
jgi:hypothetical protein